MKTAGVLLFSADESGVLPLRQHPVRMPHSCPTLCQGKYTNIANIRGVITSLLAKVVPCQRGSSPALCQGSLGQGGSWGHGGGWATGAGLFFQELVAHAGAGDALHGGGKQEHVVVAQEGGIGVPVHVGGQLVAGNVRVARAHKLGVHVLPVAGQRGVYVEAVHFFVVLRMGSLLRGLCEVSLSSIRPAPPPGPAGGQNAGENTIPICSDE